MDLSTITDEQLEKSSRQELIALVTLLLTEVSRWQARVAELEAQLGHRPAASHFAQLFTAALARSARPMPVSSKRRSAEAPSPATSRRLVRWLKIRIA
jgi:hypothetical protein